MKKIIIAIVIALAGFCMEARAQIYVGGGMSAHFGVNTDTSTSISIYPDIGYSVGKWSFGTMLTLQTFFDPQTTNSMGFKITPYAEYYFFSVGPMSLFAEAGCGFFYGISYSENKFFVTPYLSPGLEISLSEHFSLLCHIGKLEWNSEISSIDLSFTGDPISLGLYYSF